MQPSQNSSAEGTTHTAKHGSCRILMDLQFFKEWGTGWIGVAPLLPALLDSGSLHIFQAAQSPIFSP